MAQATPDLNKIMKISDFFGVPTDFLLKDEYDLTFLDNNVGFKNVNSDENGKTTDLEKVSSNTKMIELSEIQSYLDINRKSARNFVIAILSDGKLWEAQTAHRFRQFCPLRLCGVA